MSRMYFVAKVLKRSKKHRFYLGSIYIINDQIRARPELNIIGIIHYMLVLFRTWFTNGMPCIFTLSHVNSGKK